MLFYHYFFIQCIDCFLPFSLLLPVHRWYFYLNLVLMISYWFFQCFKRNIWYKSKVKFFDSMYTWCTRCSGSCSRRCCGQSCRRLCCSQSCRRHCCSWCCCRFGSSWSCRRFGDSWSCRRFCCSCQWKIKKIKKIKVFFSIISLYFELFVMLSNNYWAAIWVYYSWLEHLNMLKELYRCDPDDQVRDFFV